jgi:fructuronate reductase
MERLAPSHLVHVPGTIRTPRYDRGALRVGWAHVGVGAFHRCHQAEYCDDMLEARFGDWGIVGVNVAPPRLEGLLAPQDGLYSRTLSKGDRRETRIVGAIKRVIDVVDTTTAKAAVDALASPDIQVVTMTVTEKGYCIIPATGALDVENPALKSDLEGASSPRTLLGLLARALERRMQRNARGVTLVSCDNIPSNGERLRGALTGFAARRSTKLTEWIEHEVAFPATMVDRIVPASAPDDFEWVSVELQARDEAAVFGEPFRQWVIEDRFAGERPPLDLAGAQFVTDAKPYEKIKMRVLNAAQSTVSHQGALAGRTFSFEAASDPVLGALTRRMLERETASTLPSVEGMEVAGYIDTSIERVRNSAIRHRCHQIGTDGSQKIAQRILDPLRELLAEGRPARLLTLSVASWIAYVCSGSSRFGARWAPSDPLARTMIAIADQAGDFRAFAAAALAVHAIFGADLVRPETIETVASDLRGLLAGDPYAYLTGFLADD